MTLKMPLDDPPGRHGSSQKGLEKTSENPRENFRSKGLGLPGRAQARPERLGTARKGPEGLGTAREGSGSPGTAWGCPEGLGASWESSEGLETDPKKRPLPSSGRS